MSWAAQNGGPGGHFSFSIPARLEDAAGADDPATVRTSAVTDAEGRGETSVTVMRSLVSVVDDDVSVRESLPDLLRVLGFAVQAFASAEEFLASDCVAHTRCLILDITMPGMSGPDLQVELTRRRQDIPIVCITGRDNETARSRALELGAVECLFKPFSDTALLQAVNAALRVN